MNDEAMLIRLNEILENKQLSFSERHSMREAIKRFQAPAHDGEVVAWRYSIKREDDSVSVRLSAIEYGKGLSPFGKRGTDYSEEYEVTCEPLYTAPPRVVDVELRAALEVAQQALMEVAHAQSEGPQWYTRGESGLHSQVDMWVRKGLAALKAALEKP